MSIGLTLLGLTLIALVLWDALETIVLTRRVINRRSLTSLFYRLTWTPWSGIGRRLGPKRGQENYLWLFGPLSVLILLGVWAVGLLIGFALLRNVAGEEASGIRYTSARRLSLRWAWPIQAQIRP
jgi:hypothetical protein